MGITMLFRGQPIENLAAGLEDAGRIRKEDIAYAWGRQKDRIISRTASGIDVDGSAFEPYSTRGPYYYSPSAGFGRKTRLQAARRAHEKLGGERNHGLTVKFPSYAAFKAASGSSIVDLTGPRAPHMMDSIVLTTDDTGGAMTISGDPGSRASGHNAGNPKRGLPRRHFFGISTGDEEILASDLGARIDERLFKAIGQ